MRVGAIEVRVRRMAGRCLNGNEGDGGRRWHAVPVDSDRALCSAEPGESSVGWSSYDGDKITCARCLARATRLHTQYVRKLKSEGATA